MKLRLIDRIFLILCGLVLLAQAVLLAAEAFFGVPVSELVNDILTLGGLAQVLAFLAWMVLLLTFSAVCFTSVIRPRNKKFGFVT